MWRSGNLISFGNQSWPGDHQALVTGDPRQNVPSGYYFNPAVFQVLAPTPHERIHCITTVYADLASGSLTRL
jgi:hypothetical protein